jgi:hypothetical protein
VWEVNAGETAGWSLFAGITALIASAWAMLLAPSRALLALGIASFVTALVTLILWWDAIWQIAESS